MAESITKKAKTVARHRIYHYFVNKHIQQQDAICLNNICYSKPNCVQ